ncbi:MAG TPA: homocysteine S-methyltransferase family protein, partial [bacterium]|nr:homocysteine S-methyltransferase family protein [bacterium]
LCFKQQAKILIDSGADGIIIETMSDIKEAICALTAVKSITNKPVIVSMTFNKNLSGYKTIMGTDVKKCIELLEKHGATAVGANCGFGIKDFIDIVGQIKHSTSLPVWIKPNAGIPRLIEGKTVYPDTPEYMASFIPKIIEEGISIIGGCCGTTPRHISKFVQVVSTYWKNQ